MDFQGEVVKECRSSARVAIRCSIVLARGGRVGEGQVVDMSAHGCLVESMISVKIGDHLQLRLFLPEAEPSMRVPQAVVRWAKGARFGVEFIGMEEKDRSRLSRFVTSQEDPWAEAYD